MECQKAGTAFIKYLSIKVFRKYILLSGADKME